MMNKSKKVQQEERERLKLAAMQEAQRLASAAPAPAPAVQQPETAPKAEVPNDNGTDSEQPPKNETPFRFSVNVGNLPPVPDDPTALEMRDAHRQAKQAEKHTDEYKLRVADMLARKKVKLKEARKKWQPWVRDNEDVLEFGLRQAQYYMELLKHRDKLSDPQKRWRTFRDAEEILYGDRPAGPAAESGSGSGAGTRPDTGPHARERKTLSIIARKLRTKPRDLWEIATLAGALKTGAEMLSYLRADAMQQLREEITRHNVAPDHQARLLERARETPETPAETGAGNDAIEPEPEQLEIEEAA